MLLLFDIDGTLLTTDGWTGSLLLEIITEVSGVVAETEGVSFAGGLDGAITRNLLEAGGLSPEEAREVLPQVAVLYGERVAGLPARHVRLLPGARELVRSLAGRTLPLGLLTGNWRAGARAKLAPVGMAEHFAFGAYGDDGELRPELLPVALERAGRVAGREIFADETLVIGDTPHDVNCARVHGARSLAVASGSFSQAELRDAGADFVYADLAEAGQAREEWLG